MVAPILIAAGTTGARVAGTRAAAQGTAGARGAESGGAATEGAAGQRVAVHEESNLQRLRRTANTLPRENPDAKEKSVARVGNLSAGFMIGLALIFDLIQFLVSFLHVIPYVGNAIAVVVAWYVAVIALLIFGVWFFILRVNYFSGKQAGLKLLASFGAFVIELIPLVDALPAITAGVVLMIVASRIEDFVGDEKAFSKLSPGGKLAAGASLVRGRRVREGNPNTSGSLDRLRSGAGRLSRFAETINLDNRTATQYGKRSEPRTARYNQAADTRSRDMALVRGKDLRGEQKQNQPTPSKANEGPRA